MLGDVQSPLCLYEARLEIEALYDGTDFSETLTRARFEELNADLFKNTLGPVKQVGVDFMLINYDQIFSKMSRL